MIIRIYNILITIFWYKGICFDSYYNDTKYLCNLRREILSEFEIVVPLNKFVLEVYILH